MRRGVFLDRDGTLNVDRGYTHRPEDLEFLPGVPEALGQLKQAGFKLAVITNQSGVARGYYTERHVRAFHDEMNRRLAEHGAQIDRFYYCPHHPEGTVERYAAKCDCRKPGGALYRQAIKDLNLDPVACFAIGDKVSDLEPAIKLGAKGVLIDTSGQPITSRKASKDYLQAPDLPAAVETVLESYRAIQSP